MNERTPHVKAILTREQKDIFFPELKAGDAKIIRLAGLISSGKTTVAKMISGDLNSTYIPEFVDSIPTSFQETRSTSPLYQQIATQLWTLDQDVKKEDIITSLSTSNVVVEDRGIVDLLAYSFYYGPKVLETVIPYAKLNRWLPALDVIFIADDQTIHDRQQKREGDKFNEEYWTSDLLPFVRQMRDIYLQIAEEANITVIDTSNKTPEEVMEEVTTRVSSYSHNSNRNLESRRHSF